MCMQFSFLFFKVTNKEICVKRFLIVFFKHLSDCDLLCLLELVTMFSVGYPLV